MIRVAPRAVSSDDAAGTFAREVATMPMGTVHEDVGVLLTADDGWILRLDGGGTWRLDVAGRTARQVRGLTGRRVRIVGRRVGFDILSVRSIGEAGIDRGT